MTTNFHEPIPFNAPGFSWIPNRRFADLDAAIQRAGLQLVDGHVDLGNNDFTGSHIILGDGHLRVDDQGNLRFSPEAPTADGDGVILPKGAPPPPPPEGGAITDPVIAPVEVVRLSGNFTNAFSLLPVGDDRLICATGGPQAYIYGSDTPSFNNWSTFQYTQQRFGYDFEDAGDALILGTGPTGRIFRSTDRGTTWQSVARLQTAAEQRGGTEVRAIQHLGGGIVLAAGSLTRRLWKSVDGGATWQDKGRPFLGNTSTRIYDFAVGTAGRVSAAVDRGNITVVYSDDQGESWETPAARPADGLSAIAALPDGRLLAGSARRTPARVYVSDDGADTWAVAANLGAGQRSTKILPLGGTRALLATGNPAGVFESTNRGDTWVQVVTAGQLHGAGFVLDMIRSGGNVYICTSGRTSVWRII